MAAPNIVGVTSIYGKTNVLQCSTSQTAIVTNAASSGTVVKVNSLIVSNKQGSSSYDCYVAIYRGTTTYYIAYTVAIPNDATMVAIAKDANIYLEEGDQLRVWSNANGVLDAVCSYEIIS
jgi:hypothetical protein